LHRAFTIEELLREASVSRRWLEYRFRERFGRTPHDYICEARVERAKQWLAEDKKLSLERIAAGCGFSDARHFRLVFRRLVGVTPREYRCSHRMAQKDRRQK
jgi:LacI family transcriptional regulator